MSRADSSTGFLAENRNLLLAVAAGVVIFIVLLGLLGFGGAIGFVGFAAYSIVWLAVIAFVLWLLYRLVVAVERIAHAQQRIAAAQNPPGGSVEIADGRDTSNEADPGTGNDTNAASEDVGDASDTDDDSDAGADA